LNEISELRKIDYLAHRTRMSQIAGLEYGMKWWWNGKWNGTISYS